MTPPSAAPLAVVAGASEPERSGCSTMTAAASPAMIAAAISRDRRQCRTDDGLIQRPQEQPEQDREEDLHLCAMAQPECWIFGE